MLLRDGEVVGLLPETRAELAVKVGLKEGRFAEVRICIVATIKLKLKLKSQ